MSVHILRSDKVFVNSSMLASLSFNILQQTFFIIIFPSVQLSSAYLSVYYQFFKIRYVEAKWEHTEIIGNQNLRDNTTDNNKNQKSFFFDVYLMLNLKQLIYV